MTDPRPKAAIIREKGSNSEREMANAMYLAGFDVKDVHMTDLISGGNVLEVVSTHIDCDNDTILIKARPEGPTCHTGSRSCFNTAYSHNFIFELARIINNRYQFPSADSYVNRLRERGVNKMAQKVGEEAVETVIAALAEEEVDFVNEASDLVFHLLVLLREKNVPLEVIARNLESRHQ